MPVLHSPPAPCAAVVRRLATVAAAPVVEVGADGCVRSMNRAAEALLRLRGGGGIGRPADALLSADALSARPTVHPVAVPDATFLVFDAAVDGSVPPDDDRVRHVGRVAEGMAHDVANLLTVMSAAAELMAPPGNPIPTDGALAELAAGIREAGALLARLAVPRDLPSDHARFDLDAAVRARLPELRRFAGDRVEVRGAPSPAPVFVSGRLSRVVEFLHHLAVTAGDCAGEAEAHLELRAGLDARGGVLTARLFVDAPAASDDGSTGSPPPRADLGACLTLGRQVARSFGGGLRFDPAAAGGMCLTLGFPSGDLPASAASRFNPPTVITPTLPTNEDDHDRMVRRR